jgi:putative phosphoserine phosphatase / 1-acylglycerol-3-phosphate O-acyltransferase
MTTTADLVSRIHAADPGPGTLACFDYDGTVISGFSAAAFYDHRLRNLELGPVELVRTLLMAQRGIESPADFGAFLDLSLGAWRGRPQAELEELGDRLFRKVIASRLHPEVWQLVTAHKRMGHRVLLASSATHFQVDPMARELEADAVLCTEVEVDGEGRLTGRALGEPLWGPAKAVGLATYAEAEGGDLDRSFAYSNGAEDEPLLRCVGFPAAISPEPALRRVAHQEGWPVLDARKRGGRPGVTDLARTSAMYGGQLAGLGLGVGIGLLRRSRKAALDVAVGPGADVALALAGVDVEVVRGREHVWSARPCVFTINHQSGLDVPVVMSILRSGVTGVAKKEARNAPVFGQLLQLADCAFIDRSDTQKAKDALAPAVERLRRDGVSLCIAPEGTRSITPRPGPFKKGAFHIAMQAQVPMVPIVIRNAGELMWRDSQTVRPGTVEVVVLPPVDTSGWTVETIDEHVAEVRQLYLDTLADWPSAPSRLLPESVA